ncbi:alpha-hydroxy-acid oxidizing protein [Azoarcus sp. L1K30]|uniref:alpha-hydroxy acid oxidase n=1 Tax=Azoarcus sp. L1K30 TaxID=2820277 RepID=UPI001B837CC1|nr:alpha-hydroxy acid oxidase [Azoarcus sp. L1K30]MBR0566720.1 alpha-hydroxy-acid oxidizing protein [Azoarcus sp. L1K30]
MNGQSPSPRTPDRIPAEILCAQDYERLAHRFIDAPAHAYIEGGSGTEATLRANLAAFTRHCIRPRLLRDLSSGHTRLTMLGREHPHPIMLAPVAFQTLVHPQGELASASAAAAMDACMVCSTLSAYSLEEVAEQAGSEKWFQLYFQPFRSSTLDLVRRAEATGYTALVVTLDTSIQSPSLRARRAGFAMPPDIVPVNLNAYPKPGQVRLARGHSVIFQGMMSEAPTWDDLAWLMAHTTLPVVIKGVLRTDDALELRRAGAAAIIVSNHGGRSLDGAPASLAALPSIRDAVGDSYPLLLDGGIRSGTDIFKALALGADAVLVGRLQMHALAVAGALGVAHLIRTLREELEICMALSGCATLAAIGPDMLQPA